MTRRSAPLLGACAVLLAGAAGIRAADQNKEFAVVAGTVFRDPGFALPEARVTLYAEAGAKPKKLQEETTNYRGEFAFRVPAREAKYVVKAAMKGYRPDEKQASISASERIDVNLILVPEAK